MQTTTFGHSIESGWSVEEFPAMDSEQTLIIVFGHRDYFGKDAPFQELRAQYPQSTIVGCSTSGEILQRTLNDESLSVAISRFEKTPIKLAKVDVSADTDSQVSGHNLAEQLNDPSLRGVLVLSNGLHVNGTALVRGMNEVLDPEVIVTGGLAGDGPHFENTWVLDGQELSRNLTIAVGFYGDALVFTHGSQGGWDRFGIERQVTKSDANILYELDNRPALDLYKEYLGEHASELPASALLFPLEIHNPEEPNKRLVRTILSVDDEQNSMTFAGDIPPGWRAQLMKASFERLIDGAEDALDQTLTDSHAQTPLCIAISCVGRRLVLGDRTEDEIDAVADGLPDDASIVGFYSYGELSPWTKGEGCELHNQTMTLTLLSENL